MKEDYIKNKLKFKIIEKGGRNFSGKTVVRHRGGRKKRNYRLIDFRRALWNCPGLIVSVEKDPNRNAWISLVSFVGGFLTYVITIDGLLPGDVIKNTPTKDNLKLGDSSFLLNIPLNVKLCNIELNLLTASGLRRSAGCHATIIEKTEKVAILIFKNKKLSIPITNFATIGKVSNDKFRYFQDFKAGKSRNLGKKPNVRGVAMNSVDHPHGGGKGKKSPNAANMSPWKKLPKGKKTHKFSF